MRTLILGFVIVFSFTSISCKKGAESSTPLENTESISIDSAMTVDTEDINFDFELEKVEELSTDSSFVNLGFPEEFSDADFLEKTVVSGNDIDVLIGSVVEKTRTDGVNSYYKNLSINYAKDNIKLKFKLPTEPIIYEKTFDYKTSQNLNVLIGGLSNNKSSAYVFQIIDLGYISVDQKSFDIKALKESMKSLSDEDKKNRYIITGIRNFVVKTTTYQESNLKGSFEYAINVAGNKYIKTTEFRKVNKIAVETTSINEYLKLEE